VSEFYMLTFWNILSFPLS